MYPIRPRRVFVHERVLADPRCVQRMSRLLTGIEPDEAPVTVDDAQLDAISRDSRWDRVKHWRTGQHHRQRDPDVIFNTYHWLEGEAATEHRRQYPNLAFGRLDGSGFVGYRDGRSLLQSRHGVCQNAHDLHSAWGCLHACDYCNIGEFLNLHLNLEEMVERLPALLDANPWLQLYKYDNQTDTITFEPEYGASALLVGFFAQREREYLMLYTKSNNVDHLLGLDHRGHTIVSCTVSSDTVARLIEKNSPRTAERVEGLRQLQAAGYHVRARFSPIVPIKGWREDNAELIRRLCAAVRLDVLTIDVLALLGYDRLVECFDLDLLDPEYVALAKELSEGEPKGKPFWPAGKQMFPHEARAEVYRFVLDRVREVDPDLPVSFCDETPEMWDEFATELAGTPARYACTCGPDSVPGNPLLRTTAPVGS